MLCLRRGIKKTSYLFNRWRETAHVDLATIEIKKNQLLSAIILCICIRKYSYNIFPRGVSQRRRLRASRKLQRDVILENFCDDLFAEYVR